MNKKKTFFIGSLILTLAIVLKAPSDLSATALGPGQIELKWQDTNTAETGYVVERSLEKKKKEKKFSRIAIMGENRNEYRDASSELKPSTTYYYRVRAYHQKRKFWPKKYSAYSAVASAKTPAAQHAGGWGGGTPPASSPPAASAPPPSQESTPPPPPPPGVFIEDFSSYIPNVCFPDSTTFGPWTTVYNGYGCNKITVDQSNSANAANAANQWLDSAPLASSSLSETHATLVVGPSFSGQLTYQVILQTMEQLRTNDPANPWEVGWMVWNYTDDDHFYYFIAKPNGWELGKRDPVYPYNQRFLATGSSPTFPTQSWTTLKITQDADNTINAYVNGVLMTTFTDTERPYTSGRIGLYSEDAHVVFDDVSVIQ